MLFEYMYITLYWLNNVIFNDLICKHRKPNHDLVLSSSSMVCFHVQWLPLCT